MPFPGDPVSKETTCNAGAAGDMGSVSGWGRCPEEGHGNPVQLSAWRITWTEEPGGLYSLGSQRVGHD